MHTVPIPGGEATFRDAEDLRGRDADLVEDYVLAAAPILAKLPQEVLEGKAGADDPEVAKAMEGFVLEPGGVRALRQIRRATVIASLASWTLERPIPETLDELADLPRDLIKALEEAVGGDAMELVAGTDYTVSSDPKADTSGSTSSEPPSTVEAASTLTPSI